MKTISMIGLINNVYNNFHIPERIKINYGYYEETFKWDKNEKWFVTLDNSTLLRIDQNKLNMEVEIIEDKKIEILEEDKIIEKLDLIYDDIIYNGDAFFKKEILMYCDNLQKKINEIIDKLEEIK